MEKSLKYLGQMPMWRDSRTGNWVERPKRIFLTGRQKWCYIDAKKDEHRVHTYEDGKVQRHGRSRHLAALWTAVRRRGFKMLGNNIEFPKNPRLPDNRGFFVKQTCLIRIEGTKTKGNEMKARFNRVPTRFGPETRFEVTPAPAAPFRDTQDNELEALKGRLLREELGRAAETELTVRLRRAANEAAALAWATQYPLLVFPTLFDEKARTAQVEVKRQNCIRVRSSELLAA